jgi:glutamate-1-semialdehyde aminotransferase
VTSQREWAQGNHDHYLRLVDAAIERGVMPDHDAREPWFLSYSHSDQDIDRTLEIFAEIVKTVR